MSDATATREALALLLLVLQLAQSAPVVKRLWQRRDSRGVSILSETIWSMSGFGWLVVGYQDQVWPLAVSGMLAIACSGAVVLLVLPSQPSSSRIRVTIAGLSTGIALTCAQAAGGPDAVALVLGILGAAQFLPQIRTSLHVLRHRIPTPGVSRLGSVLRALYTAGWAAWAFGPFWSATGSTPALIVWGLTGTLAYATQATAAGASAHAEAAATRSSRLTSVGPAQL